MSYQQFPPPGYPNPYPPPPYAQTYPPPPPPAGYQAYFHGGYPPAPLPPSACQPCCYHTHDSASCFSFLEGCLAALCCCCMLEECCF